MDFFLKNIQRLILLNKVLQPTFNTTSGQFKVVILQNKTNWKTSYFLHSETYGCIMNTSPYLITIKTVEFS